MNIEDNQMNADGPPNRAQNIWGAAEIDRICGEGYPDPTEEPAPRQPSMWTVDDIEKICQLGESDRNSVELDQIRNAGIEGALYIPPVMTWGVAKPQRYSHS